MKTPHIPEVVAAARAGEAAALAVVRGWLHGQDGQDAQHAQDAQDAQHGQQHRGQDRQAGQHDQQGRHRQSRPAPVRLLLVRPDRLLVDAANSAQRRRRDVFAPVPAFGQDDRLLQGLEPLTRAGCEAVRACPPLAHWLQRAAAAHLWALERRLYADDTLEAPGRRRLERELRQLHALGRPLWENWVHATPAWRATTNSTHACAPGGTRRSTGPSRSDCGAVIRARLGPFLQPTSGRVTR